MPNERENEIKLPSLDELFSSQQERDEAKLKHIYEIPIDQIDSFPDHPFKVRDDDDMMNLIESIRAQGVLTPCMVRKKKDGRYALYLKILVYNQSLWCSIQYRLFSIRIRYPL